MTTANLDRLRAANPVAGAVDVPAAWREELFDRLASIPPPDARRRQRRSHGRLLLVAAAVVALLAAPSYGVARTMIEWVRGEPAPPAVVNEFESYAPQLGYQPDRDGAILVALEGKDVRLYSTKNDKGSYCLVLTAPGGPRGDGGTCIQPAWAAEPLIAGTLGTAGGGNAASTQFIAGRTTDREVRTVEFADPAGTPIVRPIGYDGFFVAAVRVPWAACGAGDWRPAFVLRDAAGEEVGRADITLLFSHPGKGVCGFVPPHPPHVK